MIEINTAFVGIVVTLFIFLAGIIYQLGRYSQRITHNELSIKTNRAEHKADIMAFRSENREDHQLIFNKVNNLDVYVRNGRKDS